MPNNVKVIKESNFQKPPQYHNLVNIASSVIVKNIKEGITDGKDIHNKSFKKLSPITVDLKRKKRYKHPERALYATGKMQNVSLKPRATRRKPKANVSVAKDRTAIGQKHNEGIGVPQREWFGLSDRTIEDVRKRINPLLFQFYHKRKQIPQK